MALTTQPSPYFSVIIPCLNEEKFLPNLLTNLNSQSYKDFEVRVIDGNSDDNTKEVAQSFPAKYPLFVHTTTTRSASYQRNLGAQKSRGKVLIFFDADTTIPKNYLKRIHHAYETSKPHFLTTYIDVDSQKPGDKLFALFNNFIFEIGKILKTPFALGAMQSIKRTAFEDIGGYDVKTKYGEDGQLFQKLMDYNYKYKILTTPRYIFSLRRLRAEGTLETLTVFLRHNLNIFLNGFHADVDYQMGGGQYNESDTKETSYARSLQPIFAKLKKSTKERNDKLQHILERIFYSDRY